MAFAPAVLGGELYGDYYIFHKGKLYSVFRDSVEIEPLYRKRLQFIQEQIYVKGYSIKSDDDWDQLIKQSFYLST